MIKTCLTCGKQFESTDKRQRYCSIDCAYRARLNNNSKRMRSVRTDDRREWARHEAEKLYNMATTRGVDELADFVYNSYNRKGK